MGTIDHFKDAAGEAVQPYFAAFMLERGYCRAAEPFERDGHNCEFMEWIEGRWAEFERLNGIKKGGIRGHYAKSFAAWLAGRSVDHQARAVVEAA